MFIYGFVGADPDVACTPNAQKFLNCGHGAPQNPWVKAYMRTLRSHDSPEVSIFGPVLAEKICHPSHIRRTFHLCVTMAVSRRIGCSYT